MKKRILSLLLALVMAAALLPTGASAAETTPVSSNNINTQEYVNGRRWARTVKSYLYENSSGTLTRVEYLNDGDEAKVIVEDYDSSFILQSSRTIAMELPLWGGFFAGEDYNFLIFGQMNEEENDEKEVIRIVKYSKDWVRLGQASLCGANTTVPFDGGSLRFAEYGGYLYIRTCHKMFKSSDGLNHQANVMINVRQSDMKITDSFTEVMNVGCGYVSHSFNQFILIDGQGRIVTLDHGDAGDTRAAVLLRYNAKAGQDSFMEGKKIPDEQTGWYHTVFVNTVNVRDFPTAAVHYNDTGCSLGGLAETSRGYVAAYNFDGTASDLGADPRDVYLAFIGEDLSVQNVRLTDGMDATNPQVAALSLDRGYVMWNQRVATTNEWGYTYNEWVDTLHYVTYASDGTQSLVKTADHVPLSDCQPISYNGQVVWYVTNNSAPTFYALNDSGVTAHTATAGVKPAENGISYPSTQTVTVDGKAVTFECYALKDAAGNLTNYIKLRDLAAILNGSAAQFEVGYNGNVVITTKTAYTPNGSEQSTPYSGDQPYQKPNAKTLVNGQEAALDAIQITYNGGGYTYYKLRDLGQILGFNVGWGGAGIFVETDKPYDPSN